MSCRLLRRRRPRRLPRWEQLRHLLRWPQPRGSHHWLLRQSLRTAGLSCRSSLRPRRRLPLDRQAASAHSERKRPVPRRRSAANAADGTIMGHIATLSKTEMTLLALLAFISLASPFLFLVSDNCCVSPFPPLRLWREIVCWMGLREKSRVPPIL